MDTHTHKTMKEKREREDLTRECKAVFYAYDAEEIEIYSNATKAQAALYDFEQWLRNIYKHPPMSAATYTSSELYSLSKPIYDANTVERIRDHFYAKLGDLLGG